VDGEVPEDFWPPGTLGRTDPQRAGWQPRQPLYGLESTLIQAIPQKLRAFSQIPSKLLPVKLQPTKAKVHMEPGGGAAGPRPGRARAPRRPVGLCAWARRPPRAAGLPGAPAQEDGPRPRKLRSACCCLVPRYMMRWSCSSTRSHMVSHGVVKYVIVQFRYGMEFRGFSKWSQASRWWCAVGTLAWPMPRGRFVGSNLTRTACPHPALPLAYRLSRASLRCALADASSATCGLKCMRARCDASQRPLREVVSRGPVSLLGGEGISRGRVVEYAAVPCGAVLAPCGAVQCGAVQCGAVLCGPA